MNQIRKGGINSLKTISSHRVASIVGVRGCVRVGRRYRCCRIGQRSSSGGRVRVGGRRKGGSNVRRMHRGRRCQRGWCVFGQQRSGRLVVEGGWIGTAGSNQGGDNAQLCIKWNPVRFDIVQQLVTCFHLRS